MIEFRLTKKLLAPGGEMFLDVDLSIEKGEFITIYGQSGAGKTSILRMLCGLMEPDDGTIALDGEIWFNKADRVDWKPQKREVGMVFQDYMLFPNMTVKENLLFALPKKAEASIVQELIEMMELGELQNRKPETLSGGQKQRVALARALVAKPKLLLLDEPLSALDNKMRNKLQDYILKIHKHFQLTTILISHDVAEVVKLSDRVVELDNGKIIRAGKPLELFTSNHLSGKFQFTGQVLNIQKEDVVYVVTILIDSNIVRIVADEKEVEALNIGDHIVVASKAFNPVIKRINE
ncbi:ABC transporter ATP-binding protein [Prolixibacteraceae bacterium JC049]|nr:ABC transporter ATP-binding protein [Prolixibacteraceae bacterium JC049]